MSRISRKTFLLAAGILVGSAAFHGAGGAPGGEKSPDHPAAGNGPFAPASDRASENAAWHTDYRKAVAEATRLRRPLLLFFTGSDWCDWCRLLRDEVFDTPEFVAWARRTVVLVEVDFPRYHPQDAALKEQNDGLALRFADFVQEGYPTVLLLDPGGTRMLGDLGYMDGGPNPWTDAADRVLSKAR